MDAVPEREVPRRWAFVVDHAGVGEPGRVAVRRGEGRSAGHTQTMSNHTAAAAFQILGPLLINWINSRREQRHRNAAKAAAREEARQVPKPQVAVSVQVATETARRTRSVRRISEMMSARAQSSSNDVLARVGDLISSGDLDGEVLEHADQQLVADDDLNTAVDAAAAEVARNNPKISRKMARRLVVAWVYLVWSAGLMLLVLSPVPPVISAILGASGLGAPLMGTMAGKAFDKLSGESDDDAPTTTDVQTD